MIFMKKIYLAITNTFETITPQISYTTFLYKKISRSIAAFFVLFSFALAQTSYSQGTLGSYSTSALTGAAVSVPSSGVSANATFSTLTRGAGILAVSQSGEFASSCRMQPQQL